MKKIFLIFGFLLFSQNTFAAVHSVENISEKVKGDRLSLSDVNSILGTIRGFFFDNSTGFVGIGTDSPTAKLEVKETTGLAGKKAMRLKLGPGDSTVGFDITNTDSTKTHFAVLGNGKVGIGTDDPNAHLEIDSKGGAPSTDFSTTASNASLSLASSDGITGIGTGTRLLSGIGGSEYVWLQAQNSISDSAEDISLNPIGGNVGIGTSSPRAKLEITSDGEEDNDLLIHSKTTGDVGSLADWARISLMREGETDEGFLGFYGTNSADTSSGLILGVSGEHVIRFNTNGGDKMFIYPNGDVGIAGTATANGVLLESDSRYKKEIQTLPSALEKVSALRGVSYQWKDRNDDSTKIGVVAQEVEKIYPELVHTDEDGYKSVAYSNLVAPMIEAIKELNQTVIELQSQVQQLQNAQN